MRIAAFTLGAVMVATGCSAGDGAAGPSHASPAANAASAPLWAAGMVRIGNKGYFYRPGKWPTAAIPVCWDNPSPADAADRQRVQSAVTASWQAASRLKFIGWGACAASAVGIRIAISDEGPHTKGLGTQIDKMKAGMVLNFTFANWSPACAASETMRQSCVKSIAVHEFGHAIGFAHEQNRPDTPGECTQPPQGGNGTVMLTPWDPASVMNYCNPVYNNNGILSDGDISSVQQVYGKPA